MDERTLRLGYDPRPHIRRWLGNPLPPVDAPLALTPERRRIAECVYWQGPAWQILRNGVCYLHLVMDHGRMDDARHTLLDIEDHLWIRALNEARPGMISRGAFFLWSRVFAMDPLDSPHDWAASRHMHDVHPWAGLSRKRRYEIAEREHHARKSPRAHVLRDGGWTNQATRP